MSKIFSGEYSRDMWDEINDAETKSELRSALYFVCCRLQEFESQYNKHTHKTPAPSRVVVAILFFLLGFLVALAVMPL